MAATYGGPDVPVLRPARHDRKLGSAAGATAPHWTMAGAWMFSKRNGS